MSLVSSVPTRSDRSSGGRIAAPRKNLRRPYPLLAVLLIAAAGAVYLLTLRPGLDWDGDYALYILHAIAIVHGAPYGETGYLFNPGNPSWPASYPPGLPLLLAPIYAAFGLDIEAMKIVVVLCFLGFLGVFAAIARRRLPAAAALAAIAMVALNPFLLEFKNVIHAEFPFFLAGFLALHLADRLADAPDSRPNGRPDGGLSLRSSAATVIAAGLALGFAYQIRTVGAVLFCAVAAVGILRLRSAGAASVALAGVLAIGGLTAWGIGALFPADVGTYLAFFEEYPIATLIEGVRHYGDAFARLLHLPAHPTVVAWPVGAGIAALAAAGFAARVRARITVFELFFAGYAAMLLIYPIKQEPARYALPLLPLLVLYAFCGADQLARAAGGLLRERGRGAAATRAASAALGAVATLGLFAAAWLPALAALQFRPVEPPESITSAPVRDFFEQVRGVVPEDAIITAADATIVALLTGRRAIVWSLGEDDDRIWADLDAFGSDYLVENRVYDRRGGAFPFTRNNVAAMEVVVETAPLVLYRRQ